MALTSPGLIKAANEALVGIGPDINIAKLFAYDMSDEFADYGTTVKVPVAKATASELALTGGSINDYETDSGSINYENVVLNHQPKATFKAPKAADFEAPNAPYWGRMTTAMVNAIDGNISTVLGGLFTTTACTGGKVVLASVTKANVANLIASCAGRVGSTVLALNPVNYAALLSLLDASAYGGAEAIRTGYIPGIYGFKAVIQLKDLPEGVTGVLIPQDAVAVAARKTIKDEEGFIEAGTVMDENGFPITITRHFSAAKRDTFLNADVLWGAALVQPTKVQYIAAS